MDIQPLTPAFGAEITGVDVTLMSDAVFGDLFQAWLFEETLPDIPEMDLFNADFSS